MLLWKGWHNFIRMLYGYSEGKLYCNCGNFNVIFKKLFQVDILEVDQI